MSKQSRLPLALLLAAGIAGNYLSVPLFFGVDVLFGSIPVLIIVRLYGVAWGVAAAVVASAYTTYALWHHPWAAVIFTCEALVVGLLLRWRRENLALLDGVFWLLVGMPLAWLSYGHFLQFDTQFTVLVLLKQSINGITNAVLAGLALTFLPLERWTRRGDGQAPVSLRHTLFSLLVALVMLPSLVMTVIDSRREHHHIESDVRAHLDAETARIATGLQAFEAQHLGAVVALAEQAALVGVRPADALQTATAAITRAFPGFHNMYVADAGGTTVAFHPTINERNEPTIGLNFADRPYFQELRESLQPVISDVFQGRGGVFAPIVTLGAPVLVEGRFAGIALGALDLQQIPTLLASQQADAGMRATVLDRQGRVIASTDRTLAQMEPFDWRRRGQVVSTGPATYRWMPAAPNLAAMARWRGTRYVEETAPTARTRWTLVVEAPLAPYQITLYDHYIANLGAVLALLLLTLAVASALTGWLTRPLARLSQLTANLPDRLAGHRELEWPAARVGEIGSLVDNFRAMAAQLDVMFQEIQRGQATLAHQASHDALTGLPNRVLFNDRLEQALARARRHRQQVALLFLDLDRFKDINDTLGHDAGDALLQAVAERLRRCVREGDTVARQGGDEFLIILGDVVTPRAGAVAADRILGALGEGFAVRGHDLALSASIGIALYPGDGADAETLIKHADAAMYAAKEQGLNTFAFYSADRSAGIRERLELEQSLRHALERGELLVHYQPRVALASGQVMGVEALLHWQHPQLGLLAPARFVPLAEETGLALSLGEWLLRTACEQAQAWRTSGLGALTVSANLSWRQLRHPGIDELVSRVLRETGLAPDSLELELSAGSPLYDLELGAAAMARLQAVGVQLCLGNFGAGPSAFSSLNRFPLTALKIDRTFAGDLAANPRDAAVVRAVLALARDLDLKVIAAGVETPAQLGFFRRAGCYGMQGNLFSPPLPADRCTRLLAEGQCLALGAPADGGRG